MSLSTARTKDLTFTVKPFRSAGSDKLTYLAVSSYTIPKPVRWAFLLFIFSIPFEAQDLGVLSGFLSPARIAGMLFFLVYFLFYNPIAKRHFPSIPVPGYWFLGYIAVYTVGGLIIDGGFSGMIVQLITVTQLFIFFWIASDLLKDNGFATRVLLTYAVAVIILAGAMIFGIGGISQEFVPGRTTVLKEDLNGLATNMGIAVIIVMGLAFSSTFRRLSTKLLMGVLMLLPLMAMAKTGSRGGLAAFIAGLLVLSIPYGRVKLRLAPAIIGILIMITAGYIVANNPDFMERIYQSYYEQDLSRREELFPAAIEMILERPVFGWQRESWYHSFRLGEWTDANPHNLFLQVLLEVGIVGTVPLLLGMLLCARSAWKARNGKLGFLPLSLFMTVLVVSMSLGALTWKPVWLIMALAIGSAEALNESRKGFGSVKVASP